MPQFGDTGAAGSGGNKYGGGGGGGHGGGQGNNGLDASDRAKAKAIADRVAANKAKQAREKQAAADKAKAKVVADKRAKDKAAYDKALADRIANAKKTAQQAKAKRDIQAKIAKAEKAQAKKARENALAAKVAAEDAREAKAAKAAKVKAERERVAAEKIKENQKKLREYNAKQDAIEKAAAAKDKADAAKAAKKAQATKAAKEAQAAKVAKDKAAKEAQAAKVAKDKAAKDKAAKAKQEKKRLQAKADKVKEDGLKELEEKEKAPIGSAWELRSPQERGEVIDPIERMPTNDGAGMSGAGVAFYPKGYGETLEDNAPDSILGYGRALFNPMSSIITTAGQTMLNQAKYGMNEEAANLYKAFIADPSNAGKSVEELVQMARQPQMDKQQDNAYIGGQGGAGMSEKQLEMFRPRAISENNWSGLTKGQKMALMGNASGDGGMSYEGGGGGGPPNLGNGGNQGNGGMLTGSVAPTAPQAPTLGQLTTGDYTPTERPSWAPSQSGYQAPPAPQSDFAPQWNQQPQQQPSFAPQWSPQAQQPAWAPQPRSMLDAPMQLRAPPSRFLRR
jgi:hypothetical protein